MSNYIEKNLYPGENLIFKTKLHKVNLIAGIIISLFIALLTGGLGLLLLIPLLIRYYTNEYAVTSKRVVVKSGWFGTNTLEINRSKIESVSVKQGVLEKFWGAGSIIIGGTGGTKQVFNSIANPNELRSAMMHE